MEGTPEMPAISGASAAFVEFLTDRLKAELPGHFGAGGTKRVLLERPDRMREKNAEGLSVWLYLLEHNPGQMNRPEHRQPDQSHSLLPLKAHYLCTPSVGTGGEDGTRVEQDILETVLRAFEQHPLLREAASDAALTVRLEHLDIEAMRTIWGAVGRPYDLSVSYEVALELAEIRGGDPPP